MPGPKQPERGTKTPYRARYRVNVGPCEGIDNAHDISTPVDEALIEAINVRVHDGIVVNRFGQTNMTGDSPMTGCVMGLTPVQYIGAKFFLAPPNSLTANAHFDAYNGRAGAADAYSRVTDDLQNDVFPLRTEAFGDPTGRYCFVFWAGAPHMVATQAGSSSYALYRIIPPEDDGEVTDMQIEEVFKFPDGISPCSIVTLPEGGEDGQLVEPIFFGTSGGGVLGYSNRLVTLLAEGEMTGRVILTRLHNTIYAFASNECLRHRGWSTGDAMLNSGAPAWDVVALPAGAMPLGVDDFRPTCWAERGDYLYVGGWDETAYAAEVDAAVILRLESPAATLSPVVTIGYVPSTRLNTGKVSEMVTHKGVLFFAFTWDRPASQQCDMGSYDGIMWREELFNFGSEGIPYVGRMLSVGDLVYFTRGGPGESKLATIYADGGSTVNVNDLVDVFALGLDAGELPACDMIPW